MTADPVDEVEGCETVVLDRDGDGFDATDCNDFSAAVHPGALDVLDNGVDENCDGADAIDADRDRDGFPRPADCNDADPAVHPGAAEVAGDVDDENCDGRAAAFPRITSGVPYRFRVMGDHRTRVLLLAVRDAPVGATIRMRCRGRGCPKRARRIVAKGLKQIPLTQFFTRPLRPGAVIDVRITAPDRSQGAALHNAGRQAPEAPTNRLRPTGRDQGRRASRREPETSAHPAVERDARPVARASASASVMAPRVGVPY